MIIVEIRLNDKINTYLLQFQPLDGKSNLDNF